MRNSRIPQKKHLELVIFHDRRYKAHIFFYESNLNLITDFFRSLAFLREAAWAFVLFFFVETRSSRTWCDSLSWVVIRPRVLLVGFPRANVAKIWAAYMEICPACSRLSSSKRNQLMRRKIIKGSQRNIAGGRCREAWKTGYIYNPIRKHSLNEHLSSSIYFLVFYWVLTQKGFASSKCRLNGKRHGKGLVKMHHVWFSDKARETGESERAKKRERNATHECFTGFFPRW